MDSRNLRLDEPHVRPITQQVLGLRKRGLVVPNADPNDGGVNAKALFFLTTPGPKAVVSGFVSCENPDPTATNMRRSWETAGLYRKDVALWNVVPQDISTTREGGDPSIEDIRNAAVDTQCFIDLFRSLLAVVFCGPTYTQKAMPYLRYPTGVKIFKTFHTGGQAYNHPRCSEAIRKTFRDVANLINR